MISQRQIFNMLMESQYWPPEQLRAYQRSQLEQLLRHAKANVPFYATRLDCVFRRDGSIDWDKWEEIPIVTREDLRDSRDEMQARVLPQGHGHTEVFQSSGSTGMPVSITHTWLEGQVSEAARFRSHRWHQLDWSRNFCARSILQFSDSAVPPRDTKAIWGPDWATQKGQRFILKDDAVPESTLEYIEANEISYLGARPSVAHAVAISAMRTGRSVQLDAVLTHGEKPSQKMIEDCKAAFGARVIELYSSTEAYKIAHPCPITNDLHVNAECMLLELVDEHGVTLQPGEAGRVIITTIFNAVQPLIRFEQSDTARFGPMCRCGRTLPVISELYGRTNHLFDLPGGRKLTLHMPARLYSVLATDILQIAQTAALDFEVRYVPEGKPENDAHEQYTSYMRKKFDAPVNVHFRELLPPGFDPARKLQECVNEWTGG